MFNIEGHTVRTLGLVLCQHRYIYIRYNTIRILVHMRTALVTRFEPMSRVVRV